MAFFKRVNINGKKYSEQQCTDLAGRAVDSIMMTGFSSTEELFNLLKVNCMGSDLVIDVALRELATIYNDRAAKDASLLYAKNSFQGLRSSYVMNIVLMDEKLKMIADIRSRIAMQKIPECELKGLPIGETLEEPIKDVSSIISSLAAAIPENNKVITIPEKEA